MKYTNDDLIFAVKNSKTYQEVCTRLEIYPSGKSYMDMKQILKTLDVDTSHFCRKNNMDTVRKNVRPLENYLENKYPISTHRLKKRLIRDGIMEHKCYNCNLDKWLEIKIPLEMHHKDGNNKNNNLENLILLCPNCHALTDNYRGRNQARSTKTVEHITEKKEHKRLDSSNTPCVSCGNLRWNKAKTGLCSVCLKLSYRRVERPSIEILEQQTKKLGFCGTARLYGVSDNAIRKWVGLKK